MPFCILAGRYGTSRLQTGGEESQLVPWLGSLGIDQGLESRVSTELATTVMTGLPWAPQGRGDSDCRNEKIRQTVQFDHRLQTRPCQSRVRGSTLGSVGPTNRHGWEAGNPVLSHTRKIFLELAKAFCVSREFLGSKSKNVKFVAKPSQLIRRSYLRVLLENLHNKIPGLTYFDVLLVFRK